MAQEAGKDYDILSAVKSILTRREFYLLWIARFGVLLLSQAISAFYKVGASQIVLKFKAIVKEDSSNRIDVIIYGLRKQFDLNWAV